ncbi:sulfotransferase family protein [Shimia ponticola]|uniref:sulfotransferase family protein n=1 Tax=Shimia ponticola TaxID=2582893 RepID=UPI0011BF522D|nr:sulfotransferase [Shimia ponticola]
MNTRSSIVGEVTPISAHPDQFLFVIGAMKSGTTSVFRLLSNHPQVCRPAEKEPDFFSDNDVWANGFDAYYNLWEWLPGKHVVALEASTSYAKFPMLPHVPDRMSTLSGARMKFVYIVRNPIERIESHARHALYEGWFNGLNLSNDGTSSLIECTKYAQQIDQYVQRFPAEDLLILTNDELRSDPRGAVLKICEHAGLDPKMLPEADLEKANDGGQYSRARWSNTFAQSKAPVSMAIKYVLKLVVGLERLRRWHNSDALRVTGPRYQLDETERAEVMEILTPDLRRLRDTYGVDIKGLWGIDV